MLRARVDARDDARIRAAKVIPAQIPDAQLRDDFRRKLHPLRGGDHAPEFRFLALRVLRRGAVVARVAGERARVRVKKVVQRFERGLESRVSARRAGEAAFERGERVDAAALHPDFSAARAAQKFFLRGGDRRSPVLDAEQAALRMNADVAQHVCDEHRHVSAAELHEFFVRRVADARPQTIADLAPAREVDRAQLQRAHQAPLARERDEIVMPHVVEDEDLSGLKLAPRRQHRGRARRRRAPALFDRVDDDAVGQMPHQIPQRPASRHARRSELFRRRIVAGKRLRAFRAATPAIPLREQRVVGARAAAVDSELNV